MRFAKAVVKHRILILILTVALLVPSAFGMAATRVNYDMLTYLPEDMDTHPVELKYLWLVFPDDGTDAVPHVMEIRPNP